MTSVVIWCYWIELKELHESVCFLPAQCNMLWKCEISHSIGDVHCVFAQVALRNITLRLTRVCASLAGKVAAAGELTNSAASSLGCVHVSGQKNTICTSRQVWAKLLPGSINTLSDPLKETSKEYKPSLMFIQLILLFHPGKTCHISYLFMFVEHSR